MFNFVNAMKQYHSYHTNRICVFSHFIGVPMILFSLMIFLGWVEIHVPRVFSISLSWLGIMALSIYYLLLDFTLGLIAMVALAMLGLLAALFTLHGPTHFNFVLFLSLFVGGWIIQFIGHLFEGKKPAFLDNVSQIFIAPLFLLAEILFKYGYFTTLQQQIALNSDLCSLNKRSASKE